MPNLKPDTIIICVNDCSSALFALKKGSNKPNMQAAAEQLTADCIKAGLFPTFLHVSGGALIEDEHDDASRSKAKSLLGPSCSIVMWGRVLSAADAAGWELTVDICSPRRPMQNFVVSCHGRMNRAASRSTASRPALGGRQHVQTVQPAARDIPKQDGIFRPGA